MIRKQIWRRKKGRWPPIRLKYLTKEDLSLNCPTYTLKRLIVKDDDKMLVTEKTMVKNGMCAKKVMLFPCLRYQCGKDMWRYLVMSISNEFSYYKAVYDKARAMLD